MMRRDKVGRSLRIDGLDLGCNDYPDKPSVLLDIVAEGRLVALELVGGHIGFEGFGNIAVQIEDDSYFAGTVVNNCAFVYGLCKLVLIISECFSEELTPAGTVMAVHPIHLYYSLKMETRIVEIRGV